MTLLNPLVGTKSVDKRVRGLTFEPLLGLDRNGKVQPNLAEAWSVSEDGKLYTFKLRKGVKFHNGQEMEAEDGRILMKMLAASVTEIDCGIGNGRLAEYEARQLDQVQVCRHAEQVFEHDEAHLDQVRQLKSVAT